MFLKIFARFLHPTRSSYICNAAQGLFEAFGVGGTQCAARNVDIFSLDLNADWFHSRPTPYVTVFADSDSDMSDTPTSLRRQSALHHQPSARQNTHTEVAS